VDEHKQRDVVQRQVHISEGNLDKTNVCKSNEPITTHYGSRVEEDPARG